MLVRTREGVDGAAGARHGARNNVVRSYRADKLGIASHDGGGRVGVEEIPIEDASAEKECLKLVTGPRCR